MGVIGTIIFAVVAPFYGYFIMKTMNEMNVAAFKQENVLDAVLPWCGWMIVGAVVIAISKSIADIALGVVSENITAGMRKELYENVVRKDIGWHDNRENGAGVITSTLASDV